FPTLLYPVARERLPTGRRPDRLRRVFGGRHAEADRPAFEPAGTRADLAGRGYLSGERHAAAATPQAACRINPSGLAQCCVPELVVQHHSITGRDYSLSRVPILGEGTKWAQLVAGQFIDGEY